jgi:soluble lytic murein transglycosylase-like protein
LRIAKLTLKLIALLALVLVVLTALFWRKLLTPEQKLRYGMTFEAAEELRAKAASGDKDALDSYLNALVLEGNFGRAFYLIDLYGAKYSGPGGPEGLEELRKGFAEAQREALFQRSHEVRKLGPGPQFKDDNQPAYQALLYLDGYRHAALADWNSAKNLLSAIDEQKLAPPLRPYWYYFLARSYRLAGSAEEKAQVPELQKKLLSSEGSPALIARGTYNVLAWHLASNEIDAAERLLVDLTSGEESDRWAYQKSSVELANYYWAKKDVKKAWERAGWALTTRPEDRVAHAAADTLILCARAELTGKLPDGTALEGATPGSFNLPIEKGLFAAWGRNAALFGGAVEVQALLKQLVGKVPASAQADLLLGRATISAAAGDAPAISALIATPQFANASVETRAEVRFLLAKVLHAKKQWNAALEQYRAIAEMESVQTAEALLGRYLVLKEVQEPLNLQVAIPLLEECIRAGQADDSADSFAAMVKAFEELVPLLIDSSRNNEARALLADEKIQDDRTDELSSTELLAREESVRKLRSLLGFWNGYFETSVESAEPVANWSYYELARGADLTPGVQDPEVGAETAADYLAGLALPAEAEEALSVNALASQALHFNSIYYHSLWYDLPRAQWEATELLESGEITDPKVIEYVLAIAYPTPYREIVDKVAADTGVDPALIYAVMKKESNFKAQAVSGVGATGLMQLMPATARELARNRGLRGEPLTEPEVNIPLGAAYLDTLQGELAGKVAPPGPGEDAHDALVRAMLHSYNAGPANYAKWRGLYPNADATLLTDLIPNEENEEFGKRVWKYYLIYKWRLKNL